MTQSFGILLAAALLIGCSEADNSAESATETAPSAEAVVAAARVAGAELAEDAAQPTAGYTGDVVYGDPDAPIEIIEYASMTCPHCANFATNIYPEIAEKWVETGKAKLVFRNFVTNRLDLAATVAARCGGKDASGPLIKEVFARQQDWGRAEDPISELASIVRKAGINRTKLDQCLRDQSMHQALVKVTQDGSKEFGITATPTLIINGEKVDNYGFENVDKLLSKQ